jgi:hypothetical protein
MAAEPNVRLRLSVVKPVKGIAYSLQDKESRPVDVRLADGRTLVFEIPVRLEDGKAGPRFLGDFVRTEGKTRRFVYVATGQQAGQTGTECSRRAKIDLPDVTAAMATRAAAGKLMLEAEMPGTDAKGLPTSATVKVAWSVRE